MGNSNSSSLIGTASVTHTFHDFKGMTWPKWSVSFFADNNKELRFQLGIHPKPELYPKGVLICLLHGSASKPFNLEYEVSILNDRKGKCYSKYYQFNYDQKCYQYRSVTSFIRYDELIKEANGFLPNNQLTLFCEVKIIKTESGQALGPNSKHINSKMSHDFGSILTTGDYSDFILAVGGKEFRVHKAILASRSLVFKAMLSVELEEKQKNRVEIIDVDSDVFEQLLSYIYSGTVDKLDEYALELFIAADKYQLDELKSICSKFLGTFNLTVDTVANILLRADMHSAPDLKVNCIKFITTNSAKVMETDGWKELVKANQIELMSELYEVIDKANSGCGE